MSSRIDTDLPRKLKEELAGIMRWIVEGSMKYLREGLIDISDVQAATEQYRQDSDRLTEFVKEECIVERTAWVGITELWHSYEHLSHESGKRYPLDKSTFEERITRLGCKKGRDPSGKSRAWRGIRLRRDSDN